MRLKCKDCGCEVKLSIISKPFRVQCPNCKRLPFFFEKKVAGIWVMICAAAAFIFGVVLFKLTDNYYRAWAAYMCIIAPALFFAITYPLGNFLIAMSYKLKLKKNEKR